MTLCPRPHPDEHLDSSSRNWTSKRRCPSNAALASAAVPAVARPRGGDGNRAAPSKRRKPCHHHHPSPPPQPSPNGHRLAIDFQIKTSAIQEGEEKAGWVTWDELPQPRHLRVPIPFFAQRHLFLVHKEDVFQLAVLLLRACGQNACLLPRHQLHAHVRAHISNPQSKSESVDKI